MDSAAAPSQTLYINNLNEKIKKNVLKKMLYMVFSQYGKIIEIVACKGKKLRGQAWVVFNDTVSATNALRGKQNFNFFDKPLRITYAKTKSKIVAVKEGLVAPKEKGSSGGGAVGTKRARDESESTEELIAKEARLSAQRATGCM